MSIYEDALRDELERRGWRLVAYNDGSGNKAARYTATNDAGTDQRSTTPEDLLRRVDIFDADKAALKPLARETKVAKPTTKPKDDGLVAA